MAEVGSLSVMMFLREMAVLTTHFKATVTDHASLGPINMVERSVALTAGSLQSRSWEIGVGF